MINDYNMLSGLHKVAILFSVVGESLAISLVKGLSKTEIRKIRSTIREMKEVSFSVKKRVMEEFYFGFLSEQFQSDKEGGPIQPFEFLNELTDEQLVALLDKEDAPVVAMMLAQLSPEKKMLVLDKVDPREKGHILIELGSLDEIPLEGVVEVAKRLQEKSAFLPRTVDFSRGGGKDIADLIGSMSTADEEKYLQAIANEDPELMKEVKKFHLTFNDILEKFPDNIMRDLMNTMDLTDVALALKGVDQEKVDSIIGNLPQKKQAMFEPIEGAVAKREVDGARKKIVAIAREMEKEGTFSMEDFAEGGGDMVE